MRARGNCSPVDPDQANHPEQTRPGPVTDDQALDTPAPDRPEPEQAAFAGFYAVVVGMDGNPPDRALFREALHAALEDGPETFVHCGYPVARKTVANIARAFYFRTNRAGVYVPVVPQGRKRPTPLQRVLAADAFIDPRAVKAALWVMEAIRIARHFRPRQRNRPAQWAINVGACDWPTVRARVKALRAERSVVSPVTPREAVRGVASDTTEIFIGLRTGHEDQQQQQGPLPLAPVVEPEPAAEPAPPPVLRPTARQLRGIASMGGELRRAKVKPHGPDRPDSRDEADVVFSARKAQINTIRSPEWRNAQRRIGQFRGAATAAADAIRSDLDAEQPATPNGQIIAPCKHRDCNGFIRRTRPPDRQEQRCDKCLR